MVRSFGRERWAIVTMAIGTMLATMPAAAFAGHSYLTPKAPYVTLTADAPAGSGALGILSVGETYHDFEFEGLPDGIGITTGSASGTVDVYVAHEQTTVPFFGEADFINATVDKITLDTSTGAIVGAQVMIESDNGYLRFCSSSISGVADGFSQPVFWANEETNDIVDVPAGAPYGADPALAPQRQGGYAVALNTVTGDFTQIAGMGRFNHENTVAVPGYNQIVTLSGDDTFSAPSSQLYMYLANHESHVWEDKGSLWALQVTHKNGQKVEQNDPFNGANDYLDVGVDDEVQGKFIRVPKQIARGTTGLAPQAALEEWSNANNVFQFIRLEDIAVDKNDPHVIYFTDTGATRVVPDPDTGRMKRGPGGTVGMADNGRVFKLVLNHANPRMVDSLSVFADADTSSSHPKYVGWTSPDNLDTSVNSIMVQEDASNAQIWWHQLGSAGWTAVANVNDTGGESSGIVDASAWFGAGAWLLDVQAHSTFVDEQQVGDVLYKQEDGQLLMIRIPGS